MSDVKVAVLIGSLRKDSFNRRLARAIEKLAPEQLAFEHVAIDRLPLYTQEFDQDYPLACRQLKEQIEAADALLFVTPEYNRSVPGVLKNAIDIASRPWGTNSFKGKPGAVVGTSIANTGSAMAQQHLRNVLAYLDVHVLAQPEVFFRATDEILGMDGDVHSDDTRKVLRNFVDAYVGMLKRFGLG